MHFQKYAFPAVPLSLRLSEKLSTLAPQRLSCLQTTPTYDEARLLQRLSTGDQQAFRQIFETHWEQIHAVGLKIFKSPDLAKDHAQDTFMKVWHNREQLNEVRNFRAYLNVLSRNLAIDQLRKKVFTVENEAYLLSYFSMDTPDAAKTTEYKELEQLLHEAVDHLPPQMQQVFRLSRFEGLSHAEIATRMNISRVTSKSYMVRALTAIRSYMSNYQYETLMVTLLFSGLQ